MSDDIDPEKSIDAYRANIARVDASNEPRESQELRRHGNAKVRFRAWVIPWAILLLILYVLGIGPAYKYGLKTPASQNITIGVYWPLNELAKFHLPGSALAAYINLWHPMRGVMCFPDKKCGLIFASDPDVEPLYRHGQGRIHR